MPAIGDQQNVNHSDSYEFPNTDLHLRTSSTHLTTASLASIILNIFPFDSVAMTLPTAVAPNINDLVLGSTGVVFSNFKDASFDFFAEDENLFGSPLPFDASEYGLWNGHFVPPPPRPPYFVDDPVLGDGLTICDLCTWAMPTKSTFILQGTIEKASELGWPLTLIIVSILSALLGAIIMVTAVHCKRKKSSNNRNDTHVQWWSRNKRTSNNNHLRRSNIYTSHPADSIRGLPQPTLSAASSLTAMTAVGPKKSAVAPSVVTTPTAVILQQQQYCQHKHELMHHPFQTNANQQLQAKPQRHECEFDNEYYQPHELQLPLHNQRQHSSSVSTLSATSSPSLTATMTTMMPLPIQLQQHNEWEQSTSMAVTS